MNITCLKIRYLDASKMKILPLTRARSLCKLIDFANSSSYVKNIGHTKIGGFTVSTVKPFIFACSLNFDAVLFASFSYSKDHPVVVTGRLQSPSCVIMNNEKASLTLASCCTFILRLLIVVLSIFE